MTNQMQGSQLGGRSVQVTERNRKPSRPIFSTGRMYQACEPTNQGNHATFLATLKPPTRLEHKKHRSDYYNFHDESMFTATLKRERVEAKMERLKRCEQELHR